MTTDNIKPLRASEKEVLQYLMSLLRELTQIAEAGRLPIVGYFIGMAYMEAADILRGQRPTNPNATPQEARMTDARQQHLTSAGRT